MKGVLNEWQEVYEGCKGVVLKEQNVKGSKKNNSLV